MSFDDYWVVDREKDIFSHWKEGDKEEAISDSEKIMLSIWRYYYSAIPVEGFRMRVLDQQNQRKMLYFFSIMNDLSFPTSIGT
jgi:hypothetical protein